jgi:TPR repeat protein
MLLHDDCVERDEKRAITHLKKAAALGVSAAGVLAAETIFDGSPDSRRSNTARKLLVEAAGQGNPDAQFSLGYRYTNGKGFVKSDEMAVIWYKKAASQGVAEASFNLAIKYENAFGVEKDLEEALRLYKDAASRGLVSGCRKLVRVFSGAESAFGLRDDVQEKYWNEEAVRLEQLASKAEIPLATTVLLETSRTSRRTRLAQKRLMERKASTDLLAD